MPLDHAIATRLARPIRIKAVEAIPVGLPLTKPMKMAGVEIRTADNLVVRIEAEDGTCGWGEAASAPTMTGDTLPAMVAAVRDVLAPIVKGQDARARRSRRRSTISSGEHSVSRSRICTAARCAMRSSRCG